MEIYVATVLAIKGHDGSWQYNPPRSQTVVAGTTLVFMGSPDDSKVIRDRLGGELVGGSGAAG